MAALISSLVTLKVPNPLKLVVLLPELRKSDQKPWFTQEHTISPSFSYGSLPPLRNIAASHRSWLHWCWWCCFIRCVAKPRNLILRIHITECVLRLGSISLQTIADRKCSAIVCDRMETHFCNRLRSSAILLSWSLSEMYATVGSAIACDRLRLFGNNSLCDRLRSAICDPWSSAVVCDHVETSL